MIGEHFHHGLGWSCDSVDKRVEALENHLKLADALAEAAKARLEVWSRETYQGVVDALAKYEKARNK